MTTVAEATKALVDRWSTYTSLAATSWTLDNEAFEPQALTSWARLVIRHTGSEQRTIAPSGSRVFERQGVLVVQHHVLAATGGRAALDALLQETRAIYEGRTFSGIFARGCPIREVGNVGRWFQSNVEVAFYYEEVK